MNLLPCPFCGGKAVTRRKAIGFDTVAVVVGCGSRRCPVHPETTPSNEKGILRGKVGAREAWNDRSKAPVRFRRLAKRSLKHWKQEIKRAEKDLRSGDERNARDSVVWLKGYLAALDDVKQLNEKLSHEEGGKEQL